MYIFPLCVKVRTPKGTQITYQVLRWPSRTTWCSLGGHSKEGSFQVQTCCSQQAQLKGVSGRNFAQTMHLLGLLTKGHVHDIVDWEGFVALDRCQGMCHKLFQDFGLNCAQFWELCMYLSVLSTEVGIGSSENLGLLKDTVNKGTGTERQL